MSHRLSQADTAMGYGHADRNLALIRQLEAETRELLGTLDQLDPEQSAWLQEVTSPERQAVHRCRPETATAPIKQEMLAVRVSGCHLVPVICVVA